VDPHTIARTRVSASPIKTYSSKGGKIPTVCPCCLQKGSIDDGQYIQGYFSEEHMRFWAWCKKCTNSLGANRLICIGDAEG
jgi:hypothetical protein